MALRGELDIADVPRLERALDDAITDSIGAFIVDMCALDFLDSGGIRLLLRARAMLARQDRTLVLLCPPGPVHRALDVTGVTDLFTIYASRDGAARALVPARRPGPG